MMHVTVWNEFRLEREEEEAAAVYPDGIHTVIADDLREHGYDVQTATLDDPEHGLTTDRLEWTDVLVWWGHRYHDSVDDAVVNRVTEFVRDGGGFVPLHSSHESKPFRALMGTSCALSWREADETERIWVVEPGHPVAKGIDEMIELPEVEMYGERFDVPAPDDLVFISWFEGGDVFRSGCGYYRGNGRIFYFRPGHETCPVYHQPEVRTVIRNAIDWAAPTHSTTVEYVNRDPLEPLE